METILTILFASFPLIILFVLRRDIKKRREQSQLQEKYGQAKIFTFERNEDSKDKDKVDSEDLKKSA